MSTFEIPEIMKFTVLPYALTARAWLDVEFERDLLRNPRAFLLAKSNKFPRAAQYVILRDTPGLKHYVLPFIAPALSLKSGNHLGKTIESEVGDTSDFSEFLPADVLARAATDRDFRNSLLTSPLGALSSMGHEPSDDIRVYENSETVFHIPLRRNPAQLVDFRSIYLELRGEGPLLASSKCCASGTCNDDKEMP